MENTRTFAIAELETFIKDNYIKQENADESKFRTDNAYDMYTEALWEDEMFYKNEYRKVYPHAFPGDTEDDEEPFIDEEIFYALDIYYQRGEYISPEMILNATKIADDDVVYTCKVRSFKNGRFVNNYIQIYLDKEYNDDKRFQYDMDMACASICAVLRHEFVTVLEYTKMN